MTIDTARVEELISGGETLTVEFKGEKQRQLSDAEICEAIVCLANSDGGVLLVGVENDGTVTGVRSRHQGTIDPRLMQIALFNKTMPSLDTHASVHTVAGKHVLAIEVDPCPDVCSTMDGRCIHRVDGVHGPECRPFFPHQHAARRADLRRLDYSAHRIDGANWNDLDPLEIERLRQTISRLNGDRLLLSLDDHQLTQALQLVETRVTELVPNVAGLLLLGREEALRRLVPTHEITFQALGERGEVLINDWFHSPILKVLEAVEQRFSARNLEQEVTVGLFRLPIPDYAPDAFREAVNNAVLHRDYARLGTVFVQFHPDHLLITNPGGFLEGITLDNLLVHEPKPRNPRLAEAFRRIGLVETTGRGIDRIYYGQLIYGRPLPEYGTSDRDTVRVILRGGAASLAFSRLVYEQSRTGEPLSLVELLILNHLQHERRADVSSIARLTQRDEAYVRRALERLVERGFAEARGERRARVYHLSASLYRELGNSAEYVRAHGFDAIRQEAMILEYVAAHGEIRRSEVVELCGLTERQASYLLRRLVSAGRLRQEGSRRWTFYVPV